LYYASAGLKAGGFGKAMDFVRRYITNDWKLKGLSLILAVVLWFAVSQVGESKMSVSVRILPENLGKDFMITNMDTDDVFVTMSGPVSILKNLRARDVRLSIDLTDVKGGRHAINIQKTDVAVPKGVQVEAVKPDNVVIDVERVMEKRLRTIVKLDKRWAGIYKVKSWYPQYITAEGSKESLEKLDSIDTVPVEGNFVADEEELDVALDTGGLSIRKLRPETIRVVVRRM
jgi:YbbR domain-containing protein